ncbi:VgrG-related protein [Baekduia soli]|uniref:VgrG-related protein n=1 Tax=Baekduia soli TaxID=496014 RepID=A0A5B8U5U6_9ACTN|nr:VgrG-related protein [Baekduia soli]QEC48464.1 VgrG-related protein [Baekduia soli]
MSATATQHVASYDLIVDGQDLAQDQKDRVTEVRVVDHLRLPDACTVHVVYPRGDGIDTMPFDIGSTLEVGLGARQALAPVTLFKGRIVTLEPEFGTGGCSVVVRAYDRSHELHRSRVTRTFQNQTSSDIVAKIAADAGLQARCEASGEPHDFMQQDNETDWDFIWRLAERIGFEFVVADEVAHFRRPAADAEVELEWPVSLRSFRPRLTAVQQVQEVTLLAFDPKTDQAISSTATTPNQIARIGIDRGSVAGAFDGGAVHIATEPVKNGAEADALAQALLDKLANGYIAADGIAPGNPRIRAGAAVAVKGVGTKFGGTYRVATSTHVLRGGGAYETHFANSPSHTILGAVGAGAAPPRFGDHLAIGIVTNNDDPEGMGRVRCSYPALGDDVEGTWAPIASPGAGSGRGMMMLPVTGDEVLVAFEHGDTTRPYVLGALFNGVDQPGGDLLGAKDGSFAVLSDHKVHLASAEDFEVLSGGALTITVSGATGLAGTGAITVESQSDAVGVKGATEVTIEGTTGLTLKCGGSSIQLSPAGVTISGTAVSIG